MFKTLKRLKTFAYFVYAISELNKVDSTLINWAKLMMLLLWEIFVSGAIFLSAGAAILNRGIISTTITLYAFNA